MRLTLRTMLAYLDDVLDPGDAHELEQKIEESSFASGLVHRIRDSTRRLRLGAPKVEGTGMGLDANSVAEYLDSTLPPERVPDFEKVCLESDVHLAEVASSHQILTLVLGEPADVSRELRERVYRIGEAEPVPEPPAIRSPSLDDIEPANGSVAVAAAADSNGANAVRPSGATVTAQQKQGVPVKSLAITLLLVFFIVLATLQVIGLDRMKSLFGGGADSVVQREPADEGVERVVAPDPKGGAEIAPPPSSVVAAPVEQAARPSADTKPSADTGPPPTEPVESIPADAGPPAADELPPATEESATSQPSEVASVPPSVPATKPDMPQEETDAATVAPSVEEPPAEVAPMPVGRYISEEQVLAKYDGEEDAWFRLQPGSTLLAGDRLAVFPTYRPQLLLSPAVTLTVAGESVIELGAPKETSETELSLEYGRIVLVPVGDPNATVNLNLSGRVATLRFADEQSVVAIEAKRYLPPGSDPEVDAAASVVQVFAVSGKIGWEETDAAAVELQAGEVLSYINEEPAGLFEGGQFPLWLDGSNLVDIDRQSSTELRRYLAVDRPLSLSLMERTEFRRVEIRALACQSLCTLGIFDPAVEALNDETQHSYWSRQVDSLQAAMARGPDNAARVRRSLEKLDVDSSEVMYRLLRGYSSDQLAAKGAEEVVSALEHDEMSVRVLASESLRRITGKKRNFHPERAPKLEKSKVLKWQRDREDGLIVYETAPSPLPDRVPISR